MPKKLPQLVSLCIFCPTGRTYTFRNVTIVTDNETVLVFTYGAMSDGKTKTMTMLKANVIGHSTCEE